MCNCRKNKRQTNWSVANATVNQVVAANTASRDVTVSQAAGNNAGK